MPKEFYLLRPGVVKHQGTPLMPWNIVYVCWLHKLPILLLCQRPGRQGAEVYATDRRYVSGILRLISRQKCRSSLLSSTHAPPPSNSNAMSDLLTHRKKRRSTHTSCRPFSIGSALSFVVVGISRGVCPSRRHRHFFFIFFIKPTDIHLLSSQ
jgi:hypothetical protein